MKEPIWLIKSAVLAVHNMMIARFGGTDGVRDEGLFESALARPSNIYHYDHNAQITQLAAAKQQNCLYITRLLYPARVPLFLPYNCRTIVDSIYAALQQQIHPARH